MSRVCMPIKVKADEMEDKLNKLSDFADTLDLKILSSYTVDFEMNEVERIHIDIIPVKYKEF